jgi:hypothetical protein
MADVFDCLSEARDLIVGGKLPNADPLCRRAYESLSLIHLCSLESTWAEKWQRGERIENVDVRRNLDKILMGESEIEMEELYDFFCTATHPSRAHVDARSLGEENDFILGAISKAELSLFVDYCSKHLELWYWFAVVVTHFYRYELLTHDQAYILGYDKASKQGIKVKKWLLESLSRSHEEATRREPDSDIDP